MGRILITGASGGLGEALALRYAKPGHTLLLWGRDRDRLEAVAAACRDKGASVAIRSLDLTFVDVAITEARAADDEEPIGLALFVAGLGDIRPAGAAVESPELVAELGLVNFVAPCALASALAERMAKRRKGEIVLIGSAAAFHALPFAAAYAGAKAGLSRFAEALRLGISEHGVHVMLVSPGFIDTPAGRKVSGPKPFLMQPTYVASRIADAIERRRTHLVLPWPFSLLRLLDRLLPAPLRDRLLLALSPHT